MAKYSIPEVNLHKLENEMKSLENKIKKYGGNFSYKVLGEHFEEVEIHGEMKKVLFFDIEVEGELKFNDWEYCSSIENTSDGNIIVNKDGGHEIPEEYYYSAPKCDHCNSNRYRRYTYIIRNSKTGEFKQVGKACLEDYTKGLSANAIAQLAEFFKNIQKISKDRSNEIYYENTEKLLISLQAYLDKRRVKYHKTLNIPNDYDGSKELRARFISGYNEYKPCKNTWTPKKVNCGYTPRNFYSNYISTYKVEIAEDKVEQYTNLVKAAREWFEAQADDRGNEFHNYKTLIKQEEIPFEDVGILCNGFVEYTSKYAVEKELEVYNKIRNTWTKEQDEKNLKIIRQLQKYTKNENKSEKYGHITIVKRISVLYDTKYGFSSSDRFWLDSENNLYELALSDIPNELDLNKPFVIRNIKFSNIHTRTCNNWLYNPVENTEIKYYTISKVRNNYGEIVTTYENTDKIINEEFDVREDMTGDVKLPERIEEFGGNVDDVITVDIISGFRKETTSYKGSILYEGMDNKGRIYGVWSKKPIETNKPMKLTGKVWKQNDYRGKKSTLVNIEMLEIL